MTSPYLVTVRARELWNDTQLDVRPGERWLIEATGEWMDWKTPSGPEGYVEPKLELFERLRRMPQAPWFSLVAAVGNARETFVLIGRSGELRPTRAGRLQLFANDVSFMYWNNAGELAVSIQRLA